MISNFRSQFVDDPFFSMHQERMRGADEILSSFFNSDPFLALTDGSEPQRQRNRGRGGSRDQDFDSSMDLMMARNPFDSINSMMRNMHNMMGNLSQQMNEMRTDPNAHVYSQSSVMSYSNTGNGQPKVYEATTATRQMPGGLRETRKAVRDSEAALEKMAIGRHINDRGNVIMRQRNTRTGDVDENRDYINMAEEDEPQFEEEWQEKSHKYYSNYGRNAVGQERGHRRAIDTGRTNVRRREAPAVEAAPRETRHQRHTRHK